MVNLLEKLEIKRALISVFDKTGIVDFARFLGENGVELVSTGGTLKKLAEAGLQVKAVEELTGFPEIMNGRVKTLHPKIHAGLLADKKNQKHLGQIKSLGIEPFDLLVVNLYPFQQTISNPQARLADVVENIDIGGPAMLRAAAKNFESIVVACELEQYAEIIEEMKKLNGSVSLETRKNLAVKAFQLTAFYDSMVSSHLNERFSLGFGPKRIAFGFDKKQDCRYGENPHQKGALYSEPNPRPLSVVNARQLHGKELSYNNFLDLNAAIELVAEFSEPTAAILKHNNPCGIASAESLAKAFKLAFECDRQSAFGGIIALNKAVDTATAKQIASFFNEAVIAPRFEEAALNILKSKKDLRLLELQALSAKNNAIGLYFKKILGGLLLTELNSHELEESKLSFVSKKRPTKRQLQDLLFAWRVCKHVRSNAIVLAKNAATIGIGIGQTSRIASVEIALKNAGKKSKGSALASDGFFPFSDSMRLVAKKGVAAVIEPGGSIRDKEVVEEASKKGIALVFTGVRNFRH